MPWPSCGGSTRLPTIAFLERVKLMPTRDDPAGIYRFEELDPELERRLAMQEKPDFSEFWKNPVRP